MQQPKQAAQPAMAVGLLLILARLSHRLQRTSLNQLDLLEQFFGLRFVGLLKLDHMQHRRVIHPCWAAHATHAPLR